MDSLPKTMFVIETGTYEAANGYYHSWQLLSSSLYTSLEEAAKKLRSWASDLKLLGKTYEVTKESYVNGSIASTFVNFKERGQLKRAQIFPMFVEG